METMMPSFTDSELAYLKTSAGWGGSRPSAPDGTPHVAPVGWSYNAEYNSIDIGGRRFEETKKYRDVQPVGELRFSSMTWRSVEPWRPRCIEVRGHTQVVDDPAPMIRIYPDRVVTWGFTERGRH
jgi:pyridoxamine 5'-phosphate oxidase family protein